MRRSFEGGAQSGAALKRVNTVRQYKNKHYCLRKCDFNQRIAGSIIQDGRRLRSGARLSVLFTVCSTIFMICSAIRNRTIPKHDLSPHCLNAWQIFGLFCYGMVQFPNTIFRHANQCVVYMYSISFP